MVCGGTDIFGVFKDGGFGLLSKGYGFHENSFPYRRPARTLFGKTTTNNKTITAMKKNYVNPQTAASCTMTVTMLCASGGGVTPPGVPVTDGGDPDGAI